MVYDHDFIYKKKYKLPMTFENLDYLGMSVIYDDENISVFTTERFSNPISNNYSYISFDSEVHILNKKNMGVYIPNFLVIRTVIENPGEIPDVFSKLERVSYDKIKDEYTIIFSIQKLPSKNVDKITYNKNPIIQNYVIKPKVKKDKESNPFVLKDYYEKRRNDNKILSRDSAYGLNWYYLEEVGSVSDKKIIR